MCVHTCALYGGQKSRLRVSLKHPSPYILRQYLTQNLELTNWSHQLARQTCQKALGIHPPASTSPAPAMWACISCLSFHVGSVGQTPVLILTLQSLYQLSHLPISVFIKYWQTWERISFLPQVCMNVYKVFILQKTECTCNLKPPPRIYAKARWCDGHSSHHKNKRTWI